MVYKFRIWVWTPMVTNIHVSAKDDEDAIKIIKSLDLNNFNWEREGMIHKRTTYEVVKSDEPAKEPVPTNRQKF